MDIDYIFEDTRSNHDQFTTTSTIKSMGSQEMLQEVNDKPKCHEDEFMAIPRLRIPKFSVLKEPIQKLENNKGEIKQINGERISGKVRPEVNDETKKLLSDSKKSLALFKLYSELKDRFDGRRGNELIMQLIGMAELHRFNAHSITQKCSTMVNEFRLLLDFSKKRNMRQRVPAQFSLIKHMENNKDNDSTTAMTQKVYTELDEIKIYSSFTRARALSTYLNKKKQRKSADFIRYYERQKLANTRLRTKGKFVKKARIDIKEVAKDITKSS